MLPEASRPETGLLACREMRIGQIIEDEILLA
jgi:hypothetical protein